MANGEQRATATGDNSAEYMHFKEVYHTPAITNVGYTRYMLIQHLHVKPAQFAVLANTE